MFPYDGEATGISEDDIVDIYGVEKSNILLGADEPVYLKVAGQRHGG